MYSSRNTFWKTQSYNEIYMYRERVFCVLLDSIEAVHFVYHSYSYTSCAVCHNKPHMWKCRCGICYTTNKIYIYAMVFVVFGMSIRISDQDHTYQTKTSSSPILGLCNPLTLFQLKPTQFNRMCIMCNDQSPFCLKMCKTKIIMLYCTVGTCDKYSKHIMMVRSS